MLRAEQTKALKARIILLSDRLEIALKNYFRNNFVPRDEKDFGPASFRKSFESMVSDAGIDDFTFHNLRHTAITNIDEAGISKSVRKNIVRHSDGNVHQRYNNLTPDTLLSAKRKIDAFRSQIDAEQNSKVNAKMNEQKRL